MTAPLPFNLTLAADERDFKTAIDRIVSEAIVTPDPNNSAAPLEIIVGAYVITRWTRESEDDDDSGNFLIDDTSLKNEACEGHCYVWKISDIDAAGLIDIIPGAKESVICIEATDVNSPEEIGRIIRKCAVRTYLRELTPQQIRNALAANENTVPISIIYDLRV